MARLKVTDASGRQAQHELNARVLCMIGRAPDNQIVLDDPRASRHHAHIKPNDDGSFTILDGIVVNGQIKRSANKVFVNGEQKFEHALKDGDRVTIGASTLRFEQAKEERTADLSFDDKPLGHTQLLMSAKDVLTTVLRQSDPGTSGAVAPRGDKVLETLQRKANILSEIYEMSKALGAGFDLDRIFKMATDIIFRSTPANCSSAAASCDNNATRSFITLRVMVRPMVILRACASSFSSRARVAIGNNLASSAFCSVTMLSASSAMTRSAGVERKIMSVAILKMRSRSNPAPSALLIS